MKLKNTNMYILGVEVKVRSVFLRFKARLMQTAKDYSTFENAPFYFFFDYFYHKFSLFTPILIFILLYIEHSVKNYNISYF